jgi:hypothetical protein
VRARLADAAALLPRPGTRWAASDPGQPGGPTPPADTVSSAMRTLRTLVARPGGVSVRAATRAVPFEKTKTHELLAELVRQCAAEVRGTGPKARFCAPGSPPLAVVPDPSAGDPAGQDYDTEDQDDEDLDGEPGAGAWQ